MDNQTTTPTQPAVPAHPPLLATFCSAIRDYEGKPGDRNYRNNSPGNVRFSPYGYLPIYGEVKKDPDGFAIFKDYATGWLYLENFVKYKAHEFPNFTVLQFIAGVPPKWYGYSPASDGNIPQEYADFIQMRLGVGNSFTIGQLLS